MVITNYIHRNGGVRPRGGGYICPLSLEHYQQVYLDSSNTGDMSGSGTVDRSKGFTTVVVEGGSVPRPRGGEDVRSGYGHG